MSNYSDLKHKNILITGAASGIGAAQVAAFIKQGANVYALDKHQITRTDVAAFEKCDLSDETQLNQCIEKLLKKANCFDIVCNTAGILDDYQPTLAIKSEDWDQIMQTNLKSQFLITNLVLPKMLQQNNGTFINMASIAGLVAGGGGAAYTASKHAIIGYTKQLSYDYAHQGIRANCIAPGAIETPMNAADFVGSAEMAKTVAQQTPAKRWAQPSEVADLTLFLASEQSSYIHGAVVPIDGGWLIK